MNTRSRCAKLIRPAPTLPRSRTISIFIKAQLARLPTRAEIARLVLLATLATAALILLVTMLAR